MSGLMSLRFFDGGSHLNKDAGAPHLAQVFRALQQDIMGANNTFDIMPTISSPDLTAVAGADAAVTMATVKALYQECLPLFNEAADIVNEIMLPITLIPSIAGGITVPAATKLTTPLLNTDAQIYDALNDLQTLYNEIVALALEEKAVVNTGASGTISETPVVDATDVADDTATSIALINALKAAYNVADSAIIEIKDVSNDDTGKVGSALWDLF